MLFVTVDIIIIIIIIIIIYSHTWSKMQRYVHVLQL